MFVIHEVSKQTGISVRTLRYYEEIGLLFPSAKTEGGHRLYGEEELKTLQQIVFLKTLGFRLKDIQTLLNESWDWVESLDHQLAFVQEEQNKLQQMESAILGLQNALAIEGSLNESLIQKIINLSNQSNEKKQALRKQIFTVADLKLIKKLPNLNRNDPHSLEWLGLLGQLKQLRGNYAAESDPVQRIIKRMMEKAAEEYKGNESFLEKMWEIRKSSLQSEQIGLYPLEEDFIYFIEQAFTIYEIKNSQKGDLQQ
ncbi:MerR family transcriptional regulator [Lysinibacillus xylanilyticus]|uniref:MerR family transcriptional regulator n=1 Tax=Lysinibacillus xylanilyticus TaxID=582475 RepID=UPI003823C460